MRSGGKGNPTTWTPTRGRAKEEAMLEILKATAPGTPLRQAIDGIVDLGRGGLILIADEDRAKEVV